MVLPGIVTNVTAFGAVPLFVRLGPLLLDVDISVQKEDRAAWTIAIDRTMKREVDHEG